MLTTVAFLGFAAIIVIAAMNLTKFAHGLATQTGLGTSITGLILLASATSLPEFSVGFSAVAMDAADLMAGDVLGSSLINLLILATLDLLTRTKGRILSSTASAHALAGIVALLLTTIVLMGLLVDAKQTFLRLGPFSWGIIIAYALCVRLLYLDQRVAVAAAVRAHIEEEGPRYSLRVNAIGFLVCAVVIFFAAPQLAHAADKLAGMSGLGRTFFGTVFVSTMTSLPEMISTFAAIRLAATDMAIGNVLGSNAFNMLILAFTDLASPDPVLALVSNTHAITATCVLLATCVTLLCILYRAEKRWWVIEPDALLVILIIIGGLTLVYFRR
jgi:cation:H+ antiporter